jgi:hypothetical protein
MASSHRCSLCGDYFGNDIEAARHKRWCAVRVTCPKCSALPKARCTTPSGKAAARSHTERLSVAVTVPAGEMR